MVEKLVEGGSPWGVKLHDANLISPKPETGFTSNYPIVKTVRFTVHYQGWRLTSMPGRPLDEINSGATVSSADPLK